ncbi:hypothetical protein VNO77_04207 [Canavalia gladiata]|uniref:Uncharacterized protein n=1 Tax=Canavalia gladiata TaxID=3824 RepID=A0AAN9N199_CANGL
MLPHVPFPWHSFKPSRNELPLKLGEKIFTLDIHEITMGSKTPLLLKLYSKSCPNHLLQVTNVHMQAFLLKAQWGEEANEPQSGRLIALIYSKGEKSLPLDLIGTLILVLSVNLEEDLDIASGGFVVLDIEGAVDVIEGTSAIDDCINAKENAANMRLGEVVFAGFATDLRSARVGGDGGQGQCVRTRDRQVGSPVPSDRVPILLTLDLKLGHNCEVPGHNCEVPGLNLPYYGTRSMFCGTSKGC